MAQNETQHYPRTPDVATKIVDNIDNGIVVLGKDLTIHHYNRWLELQTSLKEADLLGRKIDELFPNINSKTLKRKIKTALVLKTPTFYTANTSKYLIPIKINQLKNSNFEYMQQDVSIVPFDEEKELVSLIITDQTIMANTNAQLQKSVQEIEALNKELLKERNTIDEKVLFLKIDSSGLIRDISQALQDLILYDKEELRGTNFFSFEKLHMNQETMSEVLQHMRDKRVYSFENKTLTSDGKLRWFENSLVPEYNVQGAHIGFIIFRENITSTKKLIENHEKMLANSRSAAMGEMVGMIAHQWRQPLSLINTIIATLKIKKELNLSTPELVERSYEKIQETTKFLSETIDDFREYFKPNKQITKVKLLELFDKSIFFLKEEMNQLGIEYHTKIDKDLEIETYKNELLQSIINILKNSLDAFNENDTPNKQIVVSATQSDTHLSISIEDNAGGIEQDIINKIFEPYFSTKSKNGTGLGLYMCHTIISDHLKGDITITSENEHTKVLIELPHKMLC